MTGHIINGFKKRSANGQSAGNTVANIEVSARSGCGDDITHALTSDQYRR
ncbi:hypothetical protein Tco_0659457, partial [Tanacetum coccineum]